MQTTTLFKMLLKLMFGFIILSPLQTRSSLGQTLDKTRITTNGPVNAIVSDGDYVYMGGTFTKAGYHTGAAALLSTTSDIPAEGFPKVLGTVYTVIPDGKGGWYVAGLFNKVDDTQQSNIVHILPDFSVDPNFTVTVNNFVYAMVMREDILYLGGNFTQVGELARNKLAAIHIKNGQVSDWDPNLAGNRIETLAISGNTLYIGGDFSQVGGTDRNSIAALDATTGSVKAWNPRHDTDINLVQCLAIGDAKVYIGGIFAKMGGQNHYGLAAVDTVSGEATSFNANLPASANITAVAVRGDTVYTGGKALLSAGVLALDATTGERITSFNPTLVSDVGLPEIHEILVNGNTVYVGGYFSEIGGQARNNIAALDATTGEAQPWDPKTDRLGFIRTIARNNNSILIGGSFDFLKSEPANHFLALNVKTSQLVPWDLNVNGAINTMTIHNGKLYLGGVFTQINNQNRNRIASVDLRSRALTSWNPDADDEVSTITIGNEVVYLGGKFNTIGGQARNHIAAVDKASGSTTNWNPNADNEINTIAVDDGIVYTGGSFQNVGGQVRNYVAALDAATGTATAWNPNVNGIVNVIKVSESAVYIGGNFFKIGEQERKGIAAINMLTGLAESFNASLKSGNIYDILLKNNYLIIGGAFSKSVGVNTCNSLSILNAMTGEELNYSNICFDFGHLGTVYTLALQDNHLHTGGSFQKINSFETGPYAVIDFSEGFFENVGIELSATSAPNNATDFLITITGSGFNNNTSVKLSRAGEEDIMARSINVLNSNLLEAIFDFNGASPGDWDVVVRNSDSDATTLTNAFTLLEQTTIPFGEWYSFSVKPNEPFSLRVNVPQVEDLLVLVKKSFFYMPWTSTVNLIYNENVIATKSSDIYDTDIHLKQIEKGYYVIEITSNRSGEGQILLTSTLDILTLGEWNKGQVLRSGGYDWKQFDISSDQQKLYFETEGVGMHSTLEVFLDSLGTKAPGKYWLIYDKKNRNQQGYHLKDSITSPPAGRYYIRYMDSAFILQVSGSNSKNDRINKEEQLIDQKREYLIYGSSTPSPSPPVDLIIHNLSSNKAGQGQVTIIIHGRGFYNLEKVMLTKPEHSDVLAKHFSVDSLGRAITATFDLSNVELGEWSLVVTTIDGKSVVATQPFTVEELKEPELWIDIISSNRVRVGRYQPIIYRYGNKGNVDAVGVPIIIRMPKCDFKFDPDFKLDPPFLFNENGPINWEDFDPEWKDISDVPPDMIDESNPDNPKTEIPIYIPIIPPGVEDEIPIYPLIPEGSEPFTPEGEIGQPRFDPTNNNEPNFPWQECFQEAAQFALEEGYNLALKEADECAKAIGKILMKTSFDATKPSQKIKRKVSIKQEWVGPVDAGIKCLKAAGVNIPAFKGAKIIYKIYERANKIGKITNKGDKLYGITNTCFNIEASVSKRLEKVSSITPEDKYGPAGYDPVNARTPDLKRYISTVQTFKYRIDYWNKPEATAPAAEVFIRDTLDINFDLTSFHFTEIGFMKWKVSLEGGPYFNITVDMRPDENYLVNVEGQLDPQTREVYWVHRTLDPATGELPEDPNAGYLPPIDSTGYQIGWVTYTINPKEDLPSGTVFSNQARVNFDGVGPWGPAPPYGPYINTLDIELPTSQVNELPAQVDTAFVVNWSGEDAGAGIKQFSIYVSEDGGPYDLWMDTTATSAEFVGQHGKQYAFYSVAHDNVGNMEAAPNKEDAITEVNSVTGIENEIEKLASLVKVYPVPTSTELQLEMPIQLRLLGVQIYDIVGKKFSYYDYSHSKLKEVQVIPVKHLPKGIYILHLNTSRGIIHKKVTID